MKGRRTQIALMMTSTGTCARRATVRVACVAPLPLLLFLVLAARVGLYHRAITADAPEFTLIVRSQDPLLFAPAVLKHYSECKHIGSIRILKDTSVVWNTTAVIAAVFARDISAVGEGEALWDVMEDAQIPHRFIELLDARAPHAAAAAAASAVFLATDDLWIECSDLERAFQTWRNHTDAIVGVMPIGHTLQLDSGEHAGLKYAVSAGLDKHGAYSMVSLNGAFLNVDYLRQWWQQPHEQQQHGLLPSSSSSSSSPGCDDVWINHLAALTTRRPPIYVQAQLASSEPRAHFSAKSSAYLNAISDCLSQLANSNGGKLSLVWGHASSSDQGHNHPPTTSSFYLPMVDDASTHARRKYLLSNDRLAGVSAVLVMETRPNEVASAVRHLHSRHGFIREAVVWNNKNETMNHHMFPYDIAVRYVMAPRNYFAYARYLGCLVARYEICYFQHERTRPVFVGGLYTAFLARPDVIVVASDPKAALAVRLNMTIFDASVGRLAGLADMDEGAMVHKDLVRQFVDRMSLDESRSLHERVTNADLYFTASQPRAPMVLTHNTWTNNKPRVFPTTQRIGKALAFAFTFAPAKDPQKGFVDPASERHKYFKAPCTATATANTGSRGQTRFVESCAFATSIDGRPRPLILNLEHNTTTLKTARRYAQMYERGSVLAGGASASSSSSSSSNKLLEPSAALQYHWAVDGDLKTVWRARTPSTGPSFIGLELSGSASPQTATSTGATIVGVHLWCASEPFTPLPLLQIGFYGQVGYRAAAGCSGEWTTTTTTSGDNSNNNNNLHLLKYDCPPMAGVQRVRLVIERRSMDLHVTEFAVARVDSPLLQSARAFVAGAVHDDGTTSSSSTAAAAPNLPARPPPDLGPIVYVIHGAPEDFLHGDKLAALEEACQLGNHYPGKVKIVYVGSGDDTSSSSNKNKRSAMLSLKQLAQTFAVVGSACDLAKSLSFEVIMPVHAATNGHAQDEAHALTTTVSSDALSRRRMQVYTWWLKSSNVWGARVVMFDPHNSPILYVLRRRSEAAPNTLFVARSCRRLGDDAEESLALADATTVASAADLIAQAQGPAKGNQARRIVYPLRTLPAVPEPEDEASIAAIEEVIVLVTPDTTLDDVELFSANALPTLQQRAAVRLVNVTHLARDLLLLSAGATTTTPDVGAAGTIGAHTASINVDARVKRPKWSTLSDVVYYVAIYPARALWILDSSMGAAYFASLASVGSARFVATAGAVPHWESRILAWNATCHWTPEGFAGKARELIQGRFAAPSSFPDHDHLQKHASNIVVEEWPIKRTGVPFANTVGDIVNMLAEVATTDDAIVTRQLEVVRPT